MGWWWSDNDFCSNHVAAVHFPIKRSAELFCFLFLIFYRYNSDIILKLQLCMVHYKCLREKQCFSQKISDVAFVHTLKQKWCIMLFCDHKWQLEHNDKSVNSNATKERLLLSTGKHGFFSQVFPLNWYTKTDLGHVIVQRQIPII